MPWERCAGFLVNRQQAHALHEISCPVAADGDPLSAQIIHHPPAAAARNLQVESIDPGYDPER